MIDVDQGVCGEKSDGGIIFTEQCILLLELFETLNECQPPYG
jgi:hypothetical protein